MIGRVQTARLGIDPLRAPTNVLDTEDVASSRRPCDCGETASAFGPALHQLVSGLGTRQFREPGRFACRIAPHIRDLSVTAAPCPWQRFYVVSTSLQFVGCYAVGTVVAPLCLPGGVVRVDDARGFGNVGRGVGFLEGPYCTVGVGAVGESPPLPGLTASWEPPAIGKIGLPSARCPSTVVGENVNGRTTLVRM